MPIALMGATATGKSDLAIRLAEEFGGEIISMDSRQVYRGFDVGTGKVSPADRRRIAHHLIDILDPYETNSAGEHLARAEVAFQDIEGRDRTAFFVGGTGLYFRVLFRGLIDARVTRGDQASLRRSLDAKSTLELQEKLSELDPDRAKALSSHDRVRILRAIEVCLLTGRRHSQHLAAHKIRPAWKGLKIVLTLPRPLLRRRIAERTREMYKKGWVEEVRSLLEMGFGTDCPAMRSLGYGVIAAAIQAGKDPSSTIDTVITLTQQYAKRQETFFRSEPDSLWIDVSVSGAQETARQLVRGFLVL